MPTFPLEAIARLLSGLRFDQYELVPVKVNAVEFTESVNAVSLVAMFIKRLVLAIAVRGRVVGVKFAVYTAALTIRRFPM
jgi:hypothetical protein